MNYLDITLPTLEENLALDEALLLEAEQGFTGETLRLWDAQSTFIVLGRGSKLGVEVMCDSARAARIPILRRVSGGATVLAGPGCMFYAVVLSLKARPQLRMLDEAHDFVMSNLLQVIQPLEPRAQFCGTCDLVIASRKFSGNSVRVGRDWMLYHGSLLLEMDLSQVSQWLKHPPREPDYRGGRSHREFLTNLELRRCDLAASFQAVWNARTAPQLSNQPQSSPLSVSLQSRVQQLVAEKYSQPAWNLSR